MTSSIATIRVVDAATVEASSFTKRFADCIVVTRDGKILMQRRPGGSLTAFGGHVEAGEGVMEALVRELREELGAEVWAEDVVFLGAVTEEWTGHTELVHVHFWRDTRGTVTGCYEHEAVTFDGAGAALADPGIMDYARWALAECARRGLLEK